MIQDIGENQLSNTFEAKEPKTDSYIMSFSENGIFLKKGETITYPTFGQISEWCKEQKVRLPDLIYLFSIGCDDYFLAEIPEAYRSQLKQEAYAFVRMFEVRPLHPKEKVFAACTAWHLYVWYRDNRYCGRCGERMEHDKEERMLKCLSCGNPVFPKIAPAVIVGVTNGDRILMTKYAGREYKRYALIAGFTEIGETAEQTVAREVMEEVGLKVKNIRYYKSQPWGFDQNLLLGFFCELEDEEEIQLDRRELSLAEWVDYQNVPDDAEGLSLTAEMMTVFKKEREKV